MGARIDHIEVFARSRSSETTTAQTYYLLDPAGEHQYLFRPSKEALQLVASLISGEGLKRRAGNYLLRGCAYTPQLSNLLPLISRISVSLPDANLFDVGVVSNRTRLIDIDNQIVHTIPTEDQTAVRNEIEVRRALPRDINTPELQKTDTSYPYFSETFIQGRRPRSPVNAWDELKLALTQLNTLYRDRQDAVPVEELRSDIEHRLETSDYQDEMYRQGFALLDSLELPSTVYTAKIHGDFHVRNMLVDGEGEVYLLDWERSQCDFTFRDFFNAFAVTHYDTRDPVHFVEMIRGFGECGRIYREYIDICGEHVCETPKAYNGLPVLYLLEALSRTDRDDIWKSYHELLDGIVTHESVTTYS